MRFSEYLAVVKRHFLSQKLSGTYKTESNSVFLLLFFLIGILNLTLGIIATFIYVNLFETSVPYNSDLQTSVYLPSGRVYFFLELKEFYQANLRYSKSISYDQLEGQRPKNLKSADPLAYSDGKPIYPAGLLPNTFPQDEFEIEGLEIQVDSIAWRSERDNVNQSAYSRDEVVPPPLWQDYAEVPNLGQNQRFVNWIYIAPFSSFRKLWGIVDVDREGTYTLNIVSRFPYGRKYATFVKSSFIGPRNYFLSVGLISVGSIMILFSLLAYKGFHSA